MEGTRCARGFDPTDSTYGNIPYMVIMHRGGYKMWEGIRSDSATEYARTGGGGRILEENARKGREECKNSLNTHHLIMIR